MSARRNPVLRLRAFEELATGLNSHQRGLLAAMLFELGLEADAQAEHSWKKRKGPMAAYWRAVGVYSRHTARALRDRARRRGA